jgi:hypothetical protein
MKKRTLLAVMMVALAIGSVVLDAADVQAGGWRCRRGGCRRGGCNGGSCSASTVDGSLMRTVVDASRPSSLAS